MILLYHHNISLSVCLSVSVSLSVSLSVCLSVSFSLSLSFSLSHLLSVFLIIKVVKDMVARHKCNLQNLARCNVCHSYKVSEMTKWDQLHRGKALVEKYGDKTGRSLVEFVGWRAPVLKRPANEEGEFIK